MGILAFYKVEFTHSNFFCRQNIPSPILKKKTIITQSFVTRGNLSKLELALGNYNMALAGTLVVKIKGHKNKTVRTMRLPGERIKNNLFAEFKLKKPLPKGKYKLVIRYIPRVKSEKLSLWMTTRNRYTQRDLTINGRRRPGCLVFRMYYEGSLLKGLALFAQRYAVMHPIMVICLLILFSLSAFMAIYCQMIKTTLE